MGDSSSKPVKLRNAPFVFESRGTFSFACEITIKPKNKEYADIIDIYRINVEPGCHTKVIALKKKCYTNWSYSHNLFFVHFLYLNNFDKVQIVNIKDNNCMKTRHRKNKSLVNEHSKSNPYSHHRSFSFNR